MVVGFRDFMCLVCYTGMDFLTTNPAVVVFLIMEKKGKRFGFVYFRHYRFLSNITITAPSTAIAAMIATPMPKTYVSVIDGGSGSGAAASGGAGSTTNEVSADDGQ